MTGDTRSLSTLVQADGGYTVIPELDKEIMRQLQDDSVMRSIATVKTTKTNEYQNLVSVGGTTVNRGTEGEARTETSTPKMERVDIKLNPIYAYPKPLRKFSTSPRWIFWAGCLLKSPTPSPLPKRATL